MKFSVITPFCCWHEMKVEQLHRCVGSLHNQTFPDYEHILVDNGSNIDYGLITDKLFVIPKLERLVGYKKGLEEAKGEWIVFCDSDDELLSYALDLFNQAIEKYPDYKVFNFASFHVDRYFKTRIRGVFKPARKKVGHEVFGGGNIVNGTFIFHRSLISKAMLNGLDFCNPWDFSIAFQEEFPVIKKYFIVKHPEHPKGYPKELGNPWGNDYYFFYRLTRKNHSMPLDIPVILIHHEGKQKGEYHELTD